MYGTAHAGEERRTGKDPSPPMAPLDTLLPLRYSAGHGWSSIAAAVCDSLPQCLWALTEPCPPETGVASTGAQLMTADDWANSAMTPARGRRRCRMRQNIIHEVKQFLYHEARLLDERRFHEWLELLTD